MTFNPLTSYEIIGIVVTAATAVLAYLKSGDDAKTQNAVLTSVIGAALSMVLGLRFESIPKIQEHLQAADTILRDPARRRLLERTAQSDVSDMPANSLAAVALDARMRGLQEQFGQISEGRFIVNEAEMPLFNLEMIRSGKKTIEATNFIGISKWWKEPWGESYEQANETAAIGGVSITRIFIFSGADEMSSARDIMTRESKHRIKVRYALLADIPPFTGDVIVIDDSLVGEHHLTPGKGVSEALFSINESDVSRIKFALRSIATNSRDFNSE